ncbi:MAG: diguanylate cyclase [Thiohalospira sp.]
MNERPIGPVQPTMPLSELAHRDLLRAPTTETVGEATRRMHEAGGSAVVVLDGDQPIGIWMAGDASRPEPASAASPEQPLGGVMQPAAILPADATAAEARSRLEAVGSSRLVVTDAEGGIVGWVTAVDLPATGEGGPIRDLEAALAETRARLRAEEEARQRQEQEAADLYNEMFHRNTAPKLLIDPDSGAIVDANAAALAFYGYSQEQFRGKFIQDINQLSEAAVQAERERARREERRYFEFRHRLANGEIRDVQVYSGPMVINGRTYLHSLIHDITDRRAQEQSLREYRAVFEQSRDAVMLLDRGRFLAPNPATLRLFRVADESTFTGYHPADLSPERQPDGRLSREVAQAHIEEAFERGEAFFEWRHRTVDGEEFPAEVLLSRVHLSERPVLQALVRDISERKAMERSLRQYRAAFEQSRDAVMFLDRANYLEGNPAALRMFGVDSNEAFRQYHPGDFSPAFQPDGRRSSHAAQAWMERAFEQGQAFFEWQHRTREGQDFPTEVLLSRIDRGDRPMLQVVVRDISERKAAEAARNRVLAILDATPDLVAIADREGRITYINRGGLLLLGEDPEYTGLSSRLPAWMVRPGARQVPHPEWARRRIEQEALPAAGHEGVWRGETAVLDGEGREVPVSQVILAHRDDSGEVVHFSTMMRDLSQQKEVESRLSERVKELQTLRDVIVLTTDDERSLQALLDACASRLPTGWMEPERTAARIRAAGVEAVSEPFFESRARQRAAVGDPDTLVEVEIFRRHDDPEEAFLPEEQKLLDSVVQQIHNAVVRRQAQEELKRLATHDPLTGLYNRARLHEWLEQAREEYDRYGTPFSVIMFDIDHFKAINDRYGHPAGDEVLRELARRVDEALREADVVARWGGEEFLVLAPHTDAQGAADLAERLRRQVAERPFEQVGPVTISLGVATAENGETVEQLEGRVDDALYAAKAAGRNRVVVADSGG